MSTTGGGPQLRGAIPREVPAWQADELADDCSICHTKFSLFYRRHHCRKCGRVVCGNCSSSKSTYMPATYVVSPPSQIFLESPHVPHRTCDECMEELEMIRAALRSRPSYERHGSNRRRRSTGNSVGHEYHRRSSGAGSGGVGASSGSGRNRIPSSDSSSQLSKTYDETLIQTIPITYEEEDDSCPICGSNLGKFKTDIEKENHISDCIQKAEFSGDQKRRNNRMLIYKIPSELTTPSPTPPPVSSSAPVQSTLTPSSPISTPSVTNSHGECVICFEDFEPGDTVGRLECLCIYHERCILDWFKRKGVGSCPVHAVHS